MQVNSISTGVTSKKPNFAMNYERLARESIKGTKNPQILAAFDLVNQLIPHSGLVQISKPKSGIVSMWLTDFNYRKPITTAWNPKVKGEKERSILAFLNTIAEKAGAINRASVRTKPGYSLTVAPNTVVFPNLSLVG